MRNKWVIIILMSFILGILSGCNQIEEIIDKASQLFDEQLENNEGSHQENIENGEKQTGEENNNDDAEQQTEETKNEHQKAGATDSMLPFDERLISQGYKLYNLPNGFPFEVPYHWILVEENSGDPDAEGFEGLFCFDIPLSMEGIANHFQYFDEVTQDHFGEGFDPIHKTTFAMDMGMNVKGTMEYFLDDFGNACARTVIEFGDGGFYGEDPSTMISDEELAERREGLEDWEHDSDRTRSVPDDYEKNLKYVREDGVLEGLTLGVNDILSIRDKIFNGDVEMLNIASGYPRIFPYEWYLLEVGDGSTNWSGTFCTDTSINQTIAKHNDMLSDYNADIYHFAIEAMLKPNVFSEISFAFNDEYGTGSWQGSTLFFAAPDGDFARHTCMAVEMDFSDEILE